MVTDLMRGNNSLKVAVLRKILVNEIFELGMFCAFRYYQGLCFTIIVSYENSQKDINKFRLYIRFCASYSKISPK